MTLKEAIEKFKERCESHPKYKEAIDALKMVEEKKNFSQNNPS